MDIPAIDIDRDAARDAAARELSKPIYPENSLSDRLAEWFNDLLYRLIQSGSSLPGGWFTIVVLGLLVVAAVISPPGPLRTQRGTGRLGGRHPPAGSRHRPSTRGGRHAQPDTRADGG